MRNRFESFAGSVPELNRALQKIKDFEMKRLGLRANHAMCLYYLGRHQDGLTAAQLTSYCKEDKSAISHSLHQLSEKKLIRQVLPEKGRSYRTLIYLTEEGKKLVTKLNERINAALFSGGKGLTEEQREFFYATMEQIAGNLSDYIDKQKKAPSGSQ